MPSASRIAFNVHVNRFSFSIFVSGYRCGRATEIALTDILRSKFEREETRRQRGVILKRWPCSSIDRIGAFYAEGNKGTKSEYRQALITRYRETYPLLANRVLPRQGYRNLISSAICLYRPMIAPKFAAPAAAAAAPQKQGSSYISRTYRGARTEKNIRFPPGLPLPAETPESSTTTRRCTCPICIRNATSTIGERDGRAEPRPERAARSLDPPRNIISPGESAKELRLRSAAVIRRLQSRHARLLGPRPNRIFLEARPRLSSRILTEYG